MNKKSEITDAVLQLQKILTEVEVDAVLDLDAEAKAILSELPEQTRVVIKNLVYRARVLGELAGLGLVYDGAMSLITKAITTGSRGPQETCADIVEFIKFQERRVVHAVKLSNRTEEIIELLDKKVAYSKNHPSFKQCLDLKDTISNVSAEKASNKTSGYTSSNVDFDELLKKAVPGSNAMN